MLKRILTRSTHKIYALPLLVLMPHNRCDCHCIMCDIWKNQDKKEISDSVLNNHIGSFKKLGVRRVILSGGEALMHSNLWKLCLLLKKAGIQISLFTSGITLSAHTREIVQHTDEVIVSLDGSPQVHNQIRNVPDAYQCLSKGIQELKDLDPLFRITARCVIQKMNYNHFTDIIATAKSLDVDQISFVAADVSSAAFNQNESWRDDKAPMVSLNEKEVREFERIIKDSIHQFTDLYHSKYIAESPEKMMDIVVHFKGMLGMHDFPVKKCNAPWVSAVIEADGEVKPCLFHSSFGNIHKNSFPDIINSPTAISFRKNLDTTKNPICERCISPMRIGVTQSV